MNSGLYDTPGDSATLRAAAVASRFAAPTTNASKVKRGSSSNQAIALAYRTLAAPSGRRHDRATRRTASSLPERSVSNPAAAHRGRRQGSNTPEVQDVIQLRDRHRSRQVLLVELDDDRHVPHVRAMLDQVLVQVPQALDVLFELLRLRVRDEHDAVRTAQHQLPRRVVVDLPGNRVELQTSPVP